MGILTALEKALRQLWRAKYTHFQLSKMGIESKWSLGNFWKEIHRQHKFRDCETNPMDNGAEGSRLTTCSSVIWEWNYMVLALWDQELSSCLGMPCCAMCTLQSYCSLPKPEPIRGTSNPNKHVSLVPVQNSECVELFKPCKWRRIPPSCDDQIQGYFNPTIHSSLGRDGIWSLHLLPALDSPITLPNSSTCLVCLDDVWAVPLHRSKSAIDICQYRVLQVGGRSTV